MRFFILLLFPVSFIVMGCSSTYNISDFSSKEKFEQSFNDFFVYKPVKIKLQNDSIITAPGGATIIGDSVSAGITFLKLQKQIKSSDIDSSFYFYSNSSLYTYIKLKSGKQLLAENITKDRDLINFTEIKIDYITVPVKKIVKVIHKGHAVGVPTGLIAGTTLGLIGGWLAAGEKEGFKEKVSVVSYFVIPPIIGALLGGIMGYILGYNYTYLFQ